MKNCLRAVFFIFLLSLPLVSHGVISQIAPADVQVGDEITITGSGFGAQPGTHGSVCFNSENLCYASSNKGLLSWSDSEIRVIVPSNIEPSGTLLVYKTGNKEECYPDQGYCRVYTLGIEAGSITYSFKPVITSLKDTTGKIVTIGNPGQKLVINGALFGNSGSVFFDTLSGTVISWVSNEIKVEIPKVDGITYSLKVVHRTGLSAKEIDFIAFQPPSKDPYASKQLYSVLTNVPQAWQKAPKLGEGIIVAVLDSGINVNHPDLRDRIWSNPKEKNNGIDDDNNGYVDDFIGYNFLQSNNDVSLTDIDHATMIAGIIAAEKNNDEGIVGIAPQAKIMPLVVCDIEKCSGRAVQEAVKYAADNGAKIINLSLGGFGKINDFEPHYDEIIEYAYRKGLVIVAAAGNGDYLSTQGVAAYGRYLNSNPNSPVCNDNNENMVIGVASLNNKLVKSAFSDYGSNCIDIAAPGEKIVSLSHPALSKDGTDVNEGYGTSYAAPQVSGAIALLWAEKPLLHNWEIGVIVRESGISIDEKQNSSHKGHVGKLLDTLAMLSFTPNALPALKLDRVVVNNDKIELEGQYFNKDTSVRIAYIEKGQEKEFSTGYFVNSELLKASISNIPKTERSYRIYVTRNGGSKKSNEIIVEKDFFSIVSISASKDDGQAQNDIKGYELETDTLPSNLEPLFSDLASNHRNFKAIAYLKEKAVISGYPDGTFRPETIVNRAELIKILVGGKNIEPNILQYHNCFPDVSNQWFAPYVCYAKTTGWVSGYPDGWFRPEQSVNKVEAIKMVVNSQSYSLPASFDVIPYRDVEVAAWYAPFVKVAYDKGLLEDYGDIFGVEASMKRSEISENIYRAIVIGEKAVSSFRIFTEGEVVDVARVIDGDTIELQNKKNVRLLGIDAAELSKNECFAQEAVSFLRSLIEGKQILVKGDTLNSNKDKYGRLLRYVFIDGQNMNELLLREGYVYYYDRYPIELREEFAEAENQAKNTRKGLWKACE